MNTTDTTNTAQQTSVAFLQDITTIIIFYSRYAIIMNCTPILV